MTLILLSLLCGFLSAAEPPKNFALQQLLHRKIPMFVSWDNDEFLVLCQTFRIPCGEERFQDQSFDLRSGYAFRQKNLTVREILDKIAKIHPGYSWRVTDGVLMFTSETIDGSGILGKRIANFNRNSQNAIAILDGLAHTARIHVAVYREDGYERRGGIATKFASQTKEINIACQGCTLRQLLDLTVFTHGHAMWIYIYPPSNSYFDRGTLVPITY
jgi:hypothetical protein